MCYKRYFIEIFFFFLVFLFAFAIVPRVSGEDTFLNEYMTQELLPIIPIEWQASSIYVTNTAVGQSYNGLNVTMDGLRIISSHYDGDDGLYFKTFKVDRSVGIDWTLTSLLWRLVKESAGNANNWIDTGETVHVGWVMAPPCGPVSNCRQWIMWKKVWPAVLEPVLSCGTGFERGDPGMFPVLLLTNETTMPLEVRDLMAGVFAEPFALQDLSLDNTLMMTSLIPLPEWSNFVLPPKETQEIVLEFPVIDEAVVVYHNVSELGGPIANTTTIAQFSDEPTVLEVPFDVIPRKCPTFLNLNSKGMFPAAIYGTYEFDVRIIDTSTLMLFDTVAPKEVFLKDVGCSMKTAGRRKVNRPDKCLDLVLLFDTQEALTALEEASGGQLLNNEIYDFTITGFTDLDTGGIPVEGVDQVIIRDKSGSDVTEEDCRGIATASMDGEKIQRVEVNCTGKCPSPAKCKPDSRKNMHGEIYRWCDCKKNGNEPPYCHTVGHTISKNSANVVCRGSCPPNTKCELKLKKKMCEGQIRIYECVCK
jgi:hypothetical protein